METINIAASNWQCQVYIGTQCEAFRDFVSPDTIVITDIHVQAIHGRKWDDFRTIVIEAGEHHKTLTTAESIYRKLRAMGFDRSGFLLGIGGGIVCDITGFVASTYMRGVSFAFVPTTLLAQADASIGGKNGVNLEGYKNLIGTFKQPDFILSAPGFLQSLPKKELANGLAEVVKHAIIRDEKLFDFMEASVEDILSLRAETINYLVKQSVAIKSAIVQQDVLEKGQRRLLNFGHTFGHAIEKVSGLPHGAAVSIGMIIACRKAVSISSMKAYDLERILNLLKNLGLPVSTQAAEDDIREAVLSDKKRELSNIHFVLPEGIGNAYSLLIPFEDLMNFKI